MKLDPEALKPCPFCGGEAIICGNNEHNPRHWVMCRACHACPGGDVDMLEDAMFAWNRRALPQSQDIRALVEELRRGVRSTGDMEGDIELFSIEDANETMWEAADALSCLAGEGWRPKVKPLDWIVSWGPDDEGDQSHVANTPFGNYTIERSAGKWKWGYCFDEYYDQEDFECDGLASGKALAEANWIERISPCLDLPAPSVEEKLP